MPTFTPERLAQIKEVIVAIRANDGNNQLTADAIKKRWFPDGNIVSAIQKYQDNITAQLQIMLYILTESESAL